MKKERTITFKLKDEVRINTQDLVFTNENGDEVDISRYNDCELNDLLSVGIIRVDVDQILYLAGMDGIEFDSIVEEMIVD